MAFLPAASAVRGEVERVMASRYDRWGVHVIGEEERRAAYRASQLAIACCGTVNVELALSSTPQVEGLPSPHAFPNHPHPPHLPSWRDRGLTLTLTLTSTLTLNLLQPGVVG